MRRGGGLWPAVACRLARASGRERPCSDLGRERAGSNLAVGATFPWLGSSDSPGKGKLGGSPGIPSAFPPVRVSSEASRKEAE